MKKASFSRYDATSDDEEDDINQREGAENTIGHTTSD